MLSREEAHQQIDIMKQKADKLVSIVSNNPNGLRITDAISMLSNQYTEEEAKNIIKFVIGHGYVATNAYFRLVSVDPNNPPYLYACG